MFVPVHRGRYAARESAAVWKVIMDLEFDREAVGVSARKDWRDCEEFGRIGSFLSTIPTASVALSLPVGGNSGVSALRQAAADFVRDMRVVAFEFNDACAVLGAGQESVIGAFDVSEYQSTTGFAQIAKRLGGGQ